MKNIVVWSFERKFAEYKWGRWLILNIIVPLDIFHTTIYFGLKGKCPFCGKHWTAHHEAERLSAITRIQKEMEKINVNDVTSKND